ncbi:hypothetical protein A2U01_0041752 [Trifolium medium]|uniref:Uncharacterized protein n=1 Tax=Trifolium medium TaxID=97028 RepID=A0A392QA41_9FABA|nr:hypothetical protein [Trifolium medium]
MGEKEQFIHIQKGKKDWYYRIDVKGPKSHGWTMKNIEAKRAKLGQERSMSKGRRVEPRIII